MGLTGALVMTLALGVSAAQKGAGEPSKDAHAFDAAWDMIKGDWIKKDFVESVRSRRSILAAIKAAGGMAFDTQEQKSLTFKFYEEFESRWVLRRAKALGVAIAGVEGDIVKLKIDDDDFPKSVRILRKGKAAQEIELNGAAYVRETKEWLAKAVIAGEYRDEKGGAFSFGANGRASWPDRTFRFSVATKDFEGMERDYFTLKEPGKKGKVEGFCFQWDEDTLVLVPIEAKGGTGSCGSGPVLRLARARPAGDR